MKNKAENYGNTYLRIARKAVLLEQRPLSPKEMISIAKKEGFFPNHLYGQRLDKTMSARLSVSIRDKSNSSDFFRVAPARYFLHELASKKGTPASYKKVYIGHKRSKRVKNETILVAPTQKLKKEIYGDFVPFNQEVFLNIFDNICVFMERKKAEVNYDVKQFVTFTIIYHEQLILIHTRGNFSSVSDELKGQTSVGFGGHVSSADCNLFTQGHDSLLHNSARELREEIYLDEFYSSFETVKERANIIGFINVDDNDDAKKHIAAIVGFQHDSPALPRKREMAISGLKWFDTSKKINDLSQFDLWSEAIVRNIYNGRIKLCQKRVS